jgi:hypothetical protein
MIADSGTFRDECLDKNPVAGQVDDGAIPDSGPVVGPEER